MLCLNCDQPVFERSGKWLHATTDDEKSCHRALPNGYQDRETRDAEKAFMSKWSAVLASQTAWGSHVH